MYGSRGQTMMNGGATGGMYTGYGDRRSQMSGDNSYGAPSPAIMEAMMQEGSFNPSYDRYSRGSRRSAAFEYGMGTVGPYDVEPKRMRQQMPVMTTTITVDGTGFGQPGGVLMLYGLSKKANCDHLYNLFCLYGNVMKVMFMKKKEDMGMVQMGDALAAQRVLQFLPRFKLFGQEVHLKPGNNDVIRGMREPDSRDDGSTSFKDYSEQTGHRYANVKIAAKNKPSYPTNRLYFYNLPINLDKEAVKDLFRNKDASVPEVKLFENKQGENAKVISGIAEFDSVDEAVSALAKVNNMPIEQEGSEKPFTFKMSFALGERGGDRESRGGGRFGGGRSDLRMMEAPRGGRGGRGGGPRMPIGLMGQEMPYSNYPYGEFGPSAMHQQQQDYQQQRQQYQQRQQAAMMMMDFEEDIDLTYGMPPGVSPMLAPQMGRGGGGMMGRGGGRGAGRGGRRGKQSVADSLMEY